MNNLLSSLAGQGGLGALGGVTHTFIPYIKCLAKSNC